MKRGEIYLIKRRDCIGSEITKTRPVVIVSNDILNATSGVVEVVYLTTSPRKELPTHACVNATGVPSVAICEQIDSVSLQLVRGQVGTCSEEEMAAIDKALMHSLGLTAESVEPKEMTKGITSEVAAGALDLYTKAIRALAERDVYKTILDRILGGGGCADE